jgi:hypothetical protein
MTDRQYAIGVAALIGLVATACKGGDGTEAELAFFAQRDFVPGFEHDTGWFPESSPASLRVTASAAGSTTIAALATTDGSALAPVPGSGMLSISGGLRLEVSARIDAARVEYEGVVDEFEYMLDPGSTTFDPFLLDAEAVVESSLPAAELARVPIPSVPGATLIVEVTGGEVTTAFRGTCAEAVDGVGQYIGETTTTGTVELAGTIEIEVPIVGSETFGPFPFEVPIPELVDEVDLGELSLSNAEPATAPAACGGAADTDDADDDTADDDAADDGATTTGASSDSASSADPTGTSPDSDGGATGAEGTDSADSASDSDSAGTTTTEPIGDPNYPDPDGTCPDGTVAVVLSGTELGYCAPECEQDLDCPYAATGMATPLCGISPTSTFDPCSSDADCSGVEACLDQSCATAATHCILECELGQCPASMLCADGVCLYP